MPQGSSKKEATAWRSGLDFHVFCWIQDLSNGGLPLYFSRVLMTVLPHRHSRFQNIETCVVHAARVLKEM